MKVPQNAQEMMELQSKVQPCFGFKLGHWVEFIDASTNLPCYALICDNAVKDGGCMVFYYSPVFGPDCAEAGWFTKDHFKSIRRMPTMTEIPESVRKKANKFMNSCIAGDFE